jgi:photosystem II stability/assembly factor-like uncharacterized protein
MDSRTFLYVGTENGLFILTKADGKWKFDSRSLEGWAITDIATLASQSNTVFVGTRGDGVWRSNDYGRSWEKPCYGKPGPNKVRCVTIDPRNSDTLYAGTEPIDVFVSGNRGKNWTRLDSIRQIPWVESVNYPGFTVEPHVRDIVLDPSDSNKVFVALQVGYILKSVDAGKSWKLLNRDLDADVHTIVIHPSDTNRMFIATGGYDFRKGTVKGRALYATSDGGETWSPMALEFSQEYSVPLVMHPKNPDVLYTAVANSQPSKWRRRPTGAEALMIRTKDGGKHWERFGSGDEEISRNYPEAISIDENAPEKFYIGLRSGDLYGTEDGGETWARLGVKTGHVSALRCVST